MFRNHVSWYGDSCYGDNNPIFCMNAPVKLGIATSDKTRQDLYAKRRYDRYTVLTKAQEQMYAQKHQKARAHESTELDNIPSASSNRRRNTGDQFQICSAWGKRQTSHLLPLAFARFNIQIFLERYKQTVLKL